MIDPKPTSTRSLAIRTVVATSVALAFALGVYLLISATQPDNGLVSFTFLLILPAAICAFVAYLADPWRTRSKGFYLLVPLWLLLVVIVASIFILAEGVICVLILSPLWLFSGMLGTWAMYRFRDRSDDGEDTANIFRSSGLLLFPLIAMEVEPYVPLPETTTTVTRSVVVDAPPQAIWPLLRGIPDVHAGEGRWNFSQDVVGIPRPIGARLVGEGMGAERLANWGPQVRFRERIIDWTPGRSIGWRFIFDDIEGWKFTDRHLMPDSPYFRVTTGGYRMEPLEDGKTRVTLDTHYWLKTPVNLYSQLWGEVFLGDVENNLLALVKGRAEHAGNRSAANTNPGLR